MSYGSNLPDAYRQSAHYVGSILKGAKLLICRWVTGQIRAGPLHQDGEGARYHDSLHPRRPGR
jgi:hypothetical protein